LFCSITAIICELVDEAATSGKVTHTPDVKTSLFTKKPYPNNLDSQILQESTANYFFNINASKYIYINSQKIHKG